MGGYGSGRRKTHHITNDCVPIDTSSLLKHKLLTGKLKQETSITFTGQTKDIKGKVTETHHELFCLVERYAPGSPAGNWAQCSNENTGLRTMASNIQPKKIGLNVRRHTRRFERISRGEQDIPLVSERLSSAAGGIYHPNRATAKFQPLCSNFGLLSCSIFRLRPLQGCSDQLHEGISSGKQKRSRRISICCRDGEQSASSFESRSPVLDRTLSPKFDH